MTFYRAKKTEPRVMHLRGDGRDSMLSVADLFRYGPSSLPSTLATTASGAIRPVPTPSRRGFELSADVQGPKELQPDWTGCVGEMRDLLTKAERLPPGAKGAEEAVQVAEALLRTIQPGGSGAMERRARRTYSMERLGVDVERDQLLEGAAEMRPDRPATVHRAHSQSSLFLGRAALPGAHPLALRPPRPDQAAAAAAAATLIRDAGALGMSRIPAASPAASYGDLPRARARAPSLQRMPLRRHTIDY